METDQRILIVDDEPDFSARLRTLLSSSYRVAIANDRAQAEQMTWAEKPDLIVLGTLVPRGDAFRFHQWLKKAPQFQKLPMIVLDAPWEKQLIKGWSREEGMQLEADDYLVKPIEPAALVPVLHQLLHKATDRVSAKVDESVTDTVAGPIRVLVVDDHAMIREGIRALLALQRDVQVVGEATNGMDALEKTRKLSPDVVLMDIAMPVMNGLEATQRISKEFGRAKVLMLTQYDNEENVIASTKVGALGFIPKTSASSELLAGIISVSQGKRYVRIGTA